MELDFSNVSIKSEKELVAYARRKNRRIRTYNKKHPNDSQMEELDITLLRRLYRERVVSDERNRKRAFMKKYDCRDCLEIELIEECFKNQKCKYAEVNDVQKAKKPRCPHDETGNCPYGNESGTCFGFCYREILQEFTERRRNQNDKEQEVQRIE